MHRAAHELQPLAPGDLVPLLLGRGLLVESQIVRSGLEIQDISRRNRNFTVTCTASQRYVVKQGVGDERRQTVGREAEVIELIRSLLPGDEADRSFLPEVLAFDTDRCLLIMRMVDANSMADLRIRRRLYSMRLARSLGKALGQLHCHTRAWASKVRAAERFPRFVPFPFNIANLDLQVFLTLSDGSVELARVVHKTADFADLLRAASSTTLSVCLIHGDLRFDNWLVSEDRDRPITLVDWELASLGDPGWDIGTVFANYLTSWVLSVPITRDTGPNEVLAIAGEMLLQVQGAIRSFWLAYFGRNPIPGISQEQMLIHSVRFAGARLVQNAVEQLQSATQLTGQAIYLLQLSHNILRDPVRASEGLFGVAPTGR